MTTYAYINELMGEAQRELARLRAAYPDDRGLARVRVSWGKHMTRAAGRCRGYANGDVEVTLSQHMFRRPENRPDFISTLHHELAHASVGRGHGHDAVWKARAVEFGGPKAGEVYHCLSHTQKRQKRHRVWCHGCEAEIEVTTRRVSLMRSGRVYLHVKCGGGQLSLFPNALFPKEPR